jgi:hypothetical protein
LSAVLFAFGARAPGKTQASCTFKVFPLDTTSSNTSTSLAGLNDFVTIVGSRNFLRGSSRGLIRYSGGGISYFSAPNGTATSLTDRNNSGTMTGYYFNNSSGKEAGFLLTGSHFTSISRSASPTFVYGINSWESTVGAYSVGPYPAFRGFKRYSNGGFSSINYPGALGTSPSGVNDYGTVIGSYFLPSQQDPFYSQHGFIYHNGQWATLDYPDQTVWTELNGISNAGVIIGNTIANQGGSQTVQTAFLHSNGAFKTISAPNEPFTQVTGISPKFGNDRWSGTGFFWCHERIHCDLQVVRTSSNLLHDVTDELICPTCI